MTSRGYPAVPEMLSDNNDDSVSGKEHRRKMAICINRLNMGKSNCTLDVAITPSAATTAITDARISYFSVICPAMAFDTVGQADIVAGFYVTNLKNGSATLNHRNNGSTRTIRFLIIG